jgi:uncharacterized cupredoxin-like copper-binding protein
MKRISIAVVAALAAALTLVVAAPARQDVITVKVTAKDFKFTLSRKSAPHGVVKFVVTNRGQSPHDFKIAGKKTPLIKHGKTASIKVSLKKGKTYGYLCTVPGHAQLGMKGKFRAT